MINEEKVILMTKASLYEEKEKKRNLKIIGYFKHDYLSVQLLTGWFFATLCFVLGAALWGVCHLEYFLENLHKMDIKSFGLTVLVLYVLVVAVYLCILYGVYSLRYSRARHSVGRYMQILKKISRIYAKEEAGSISGTTNGGEKHDSFT